MENICEGGLFDATINHRQEKKKCYLSIFNIGLYGGGVSENTATPLNRSVGLNWIVFGLFKLSSQSCAACCG